MLKEFRLFVVININALHIIPYWDHYGTVSNTAIQANMSRYPSGLCQPDRTVLSLLALTPTD